MPTIGRRELLLVLLGIGPEPGQTTVGLGGITRLQKLLFLLDREHNIVPTADGFDFAAYKAGPYSARLYDDLEVLENLGLIESEVVADATEPEAAEIDLLNFDDLMSSDEQNRESPYAPDAYEERRFRLTADGLKRAKVLAETPGLESVIQGIRTVKRKYGTYSLSDLLYYVYTRYPEMATASEIKDKILGKRRRP